MGDIQRGTYRRNTGENTRRGTYMERNSHGKGHTRREIHKEGDIQRRIHTVGETHKGEHTQRGTHIEGDT